MPVIYLVKMTVIPKKLRELLQTLETLKESISEEDLGCLACRFYQDGGDTNNIILILEWEIQEQVAVFENSDHYKILMGAISLLCETSEVKIGLVPTEIPDY